MICHVSITSVSEDYNRALIITPEWQLTPFWEWQIIPTSEFCMQFWQIAPTLEIRFILKSKFRKVYKHICILLPFSEWVNPKIAFLRHEKGSFAFDMFSCWEFILCMKVNVLWCISVGGDSTSILSYLGLRTCTAEVRVFLQLTSLASWLLQICCSCM